jgi:hypothetical protein
MGSSKFMLMPCFSAICIVSGQITHLPEFFQSIEHIIIISQLQKMVETTAAQTRFEVKKWNAVALWAWGK